MFHALSCSSVKLSFGPVCRGVKSILECNKERVILRGEGDEGVRERVNESMAKRGCEGASRKHAPPVPSLTRSFLLLAFSPSRPHALTAWLVELWG